MKEVHFNTKSTIEMFPWGRLYYKTRMFLYTNFHFTATANFSSSYWDKVETVRTISSPDMEPAPRWLYPICCSATLKRSLWFVEAFLTLCTQQHILLKATRCSLILRLRSQCCSDKMLHHGDDMWRCCCRGINTLISQTPFNGQPL